MSQELLALAVLLGTVALGALVAVIVRSQNKLRKKIAETRRLGQKLLRVEDELHHVMEFLAELPVISGELYAPTHRRKIPEVLLRILVRTFQPERAVILLRRRKTMAGPEFDRQLVVAAIEPTGLQVAAGTILQVGQGELGFVAKENRALDRRELDHRRTTIGTSGSSEIDNLRFDIIAPLRDAEKNLGVLALARPELHQTYLKDLVELVAKMGGQALRQATELSQIRSVADLDGLTGILNKRVLTFRLGELVFEAEEKGQRLAIFLFDIDNFKHYNDRNGHLAGDKLLRLLTRLVGELLRSETVFGRFGGEEFLVVLPGCGAPEGHLVAEKIRYSVEQFEFPHCRHQPLGRLTVSGGVACFPEHGANSTELLRAADKALYLAKDSGRNRVGEPDLRLG